MLASGVVEIALGGSLILLRSRRAAVGLFLALFFVAIVPGNIAQWRHHRDGFGLNSGLCPHRSSGLPAGPRRLGAVVDGCLGRISRLTSGRLALDQAQ